MENTEKNVKLLKSIESFFDILLKPKYLIAFIFLFAPFSIGYVTFNYFVVTYIVDIILFLILLPKIISHKRILKRNYGFYIFLFCLSFFISILFGLKYKNMIDMTTFDSSESGAFYITLFFIPMQLMFIFAIYISIESLSDIKFYLKVILLSGAIVNFMGIISILQGGVESKKFGITFEDPNYLGRFEVFLIIICTVFIIFSNITKIKKYLLGFFSLISLLFLLLSFSRAAILSFGFIAVILVFYTKSKQLKIFIISSAIATVFIFLGYAATLKSSDFVGEQFGVFSSFIDLSNATRVALNIAATNMFLDYPWTGIGFRNFYNAYINYSYLPLSFPVATNVTICHSWFFSTIAEQGLLGIIPLLTIIIFVFRDLKKITKDKVNETSFFCIGLTLYFLFIALIFNGFFNPIFFMELAFSTLAGLIAGFLKIYEWSKIK